MAAGVRRVEAVCGKQAEEYVNEQLGLLEKLKEAHKSQDLASIDNAMNALNAASPEVRGQALMLAVVVAAVMLFVATYWEGRRGAEFQ